MNTLEKTHAANIATVVQHWETRAKIYGVDLAKRGNLSLPDTVRICRGQTSENPRPNKDLYELPPPAHPEMSDNVVHWNSIVRHGVTPRWSKDKPRQQHKDLQTMAALMDTGAASVWSEVFISPLAVVDKPGAVKVDIRLINDYSFPPDASVNNYTDRSDHPLISYNPPKAIARRIHQLKQLNPATSVLLMLGDVAGAFRHVPIHADELHMFSFLYEDVLVIDLSCGFGWCGSRSYYSLAGNLINYSYEFGNRLTRKFTGNVWCDDHTCVELDEGNRCSDANIALRRAIATILGPTAINELKFTRWSTVVKALGHLWGTEAGCVSIPPDKITKAVGRVNCLLQARSITKTAVLKTIGSLRHVASCSRPARAFSSGYNLAPI
ncbi:unnamed protein product [Phytophthora fragariaefolia]|uniref:Unnamed protein product n=1 Tax=Phytophthora fragariaefolia TaxID=1490495 RepID=A0A9W6XAP9_9STRA|nr:unnamed protein product [Phytophthora fragariaefolia]